MEEMMKRTTTEMENFYALEFGLGLKGLNEMAQTKGIKDFKSAVPFYNEMDFILRKDKSGNDIQEERFLLAMVDGKFNIVARCKKVRKPNEPIKINIGESFYTYPIISIDEALQRGFDFEGGIEQVKMMASFLYSK